MSRAGMLILLGVLTIITPFSGLPIAIRSLLATIFGAFVCGIGLSFRTQESRNVAMHMGTADTTPSSPISSEVISQVPHGVSSI